MKKVFLKISQNSMENTCARVSFLKRSKACNLIKKETLALVFYGTPLVAASDVRKLSSSFDLTQTGLIF